LLLPLLLPLLLLLPSTLPLLVLPEPPQTPSSRPERSASGRPRISPLPLLLLLWLLAVILHRRREPAFVFALVVAHLTLSPEALSGGSIPRKLITPFLWLALLIAAAIFTIRGPLRASADYANDFAAPYTSARLWLQHQNPYDSEAFWKAWQTAGAPTGPIYANPSSTHSIYPPPSVVALSPFALLPWPTAWKTLIFLSTTLYLMALILLSRLISPTSYLLPRTLQLIFITLGLLFAPAQSALHVSNVTILSASLLLIGLYLLLTTEPGAPYIDSDVWASSEARPHSSTPLQKISTASILPIATLLTLSLCIKPTLAPITLLYLAYKRLWKTLTVTITLTTVTTALFQLLQPNWNWLPTLRANIDLLFTTGVASLLPENLTRSDRIDLQLPLYALTHNPNAAALLAVIICIALAALCLRVLHDHLRVPHDRRTAPIVGSVTSTSQQAQQTLDRNFLTLSTLLVIGLLPFYQRFYSAALLLLPILWTLRNITLPRARWILALCCVFLANTSVLPRRLGLHVPPTGPIHLLADALLVPHLNWLLLVLALLLIKASRHPSESPANPQKGDRNP
jgi:hypothetical protein